MTSHPNFFSQNKNILLCSIILTRFKSEVFVDKKLDGVGIGVTQTPRNMVNLKFQMQCGKVVKDVLWIGVVLK